MSIFKSLLKHLLTLLISCNLLACKAQHNDLEDGIYAEIVTSKGTMIAKLHYDKVPITVANFISLAEGTNTMVKDEYKNKKYFNGLIFHRVIDEFMIQGGDPTGTGTGSPGYKFNNEFHPDLKHDKAGVLSMANSGPNTNGSQFFIMEVAKPFLDNSYNVFGQLVEGLDIQDSISNVKTAARDKPVQDVIIKEVNIIRKGKTANSFNAAKIFENHFEEANRKKEEKEAYSKKIIATYGKKFKTQKEKATTLASGLKYYVTQKGQGEKLTSNATVSTHYAVYFENGKLLETSKLEIAEVFNKVNQRRKDANQYQPIKANISPNAGMIAGFKEGLKQLHVGDKATLFIPYHLAYGESGNREIPGKSNIIFEVEILDIIK